MEMSKKRYVLQIVVFVFFAAVLVAGCGRNKKESGNGRMQGESSGPAAMKPAEFAVEAFGIVRAPVQRVITVDFTGTVGKIHVKQGDLLKRGDPVITLDLREYRYELETLRGTLQAEELKLEKLRQELDREDRSVEQEYERISNRIDITETELRNLQRRKAEQKQLLAEDRDPEVQRIRNDVEKARADFKRAVETLEENKELLKGGAISELEFEESESAAEDLESQIVGLEYTLKQLLLTREEELENIELQVRQKETVLKNLKLDRAELSSPGLTEVSIQELEIRRIKDQIANHLEKTEKPWFLEGAVVNPYEAGLVGELFVSEGEKISPGTKCVTVIDNTSLLVEGYIPEEFIKDINTGDKAVIRPVADPEKSYPGKVSAVAAMAIERNNETVVPVTVDITEGEGFLLPNFNVDITFNPPETEKK